jgi:hypothetical protein
MHHLAEAQSPAVPQSPTFAIVRRQVGDLRAVHRSLVLVAFCLAACGCGGSTGHEDLPNMPSLNMADATDSEAGADGGAADGTADALDGTAPEGDLDAYDNSFDTTIMYADRELPDIQAAPEVGPGADAGNALPVCAPDIPANQLPDGGVVPVLDMSGGDFEIPAVFTPDGGEAPAPAGSPCASQVWLGTAQCDLFTKENAAGAMNPWNGPYGTAILPPCSDLVDAGAPSVGPGAGVPRYQLCWNLFNCIVAHACATDPSLSKCICKSSALQCLMNGGDGPCYQEELAALEIPPGKPSDEYLQVTKSFANINTMVGHAGGGINYMFQVVATNASAVCPILSGSLDAGAK